MNIYVRKAALKNRNMKMEQMRSCSHLYYHNLYIQKNKIITSLIMLIFAQMQTVIIVQHLMDSLNIGDKKYF